MFIKRFFAFVILPFFFLFSVSAHAVYDPNARNGKWYVDRLMADPTLKSSVEIKAQRNYPVSTLGADGKPIIQSKVQKSTIKLAPKAANVGKSLIKRAPAIAITQAVIALLGKSVDWVMDAENNGIKYIDYSKNANCRFDAKPITAVNLCKSQNQGFPISVNAIGTLTCSAGGSFAANCSPLSDFEPHDVFMPIDTIAQEIISQAAQGQAPAMEVMSDTALDMLEEGLLDDQLAAAADPKVFNEGESDPIDPNAPTDPSPDPDAPVDPDAKPFELPPFCSWAVIVCDFIEWYQAEPPEPEAAKSVPYGTLSGVGLDEVDRYEQRIDFQGQCPSSDFSFQMMGVTFAKPIPYHYLCDFLTQIAPWLLAMCYLGTAYFVVENV